jgi:hypothetical protein
VQLLVPPSAQQLMFLEVKWRIEGVDWRIKGQIVGVGES